jgi:glutamyl/glutaminyl-tRNA synthetase
VVKQQEIRAYYTDNFIRVYQAYNNSIADSAILNQKFVTPPFKLERTTWIKPSFFWMMYRCGWGHKENQQRILAIDITHEGFNWAISNSVLSHFDSSIYDNSNEWLIAKKTKAVVIQWDPERDIFLNKLNYKAIQIGLKPPAAKLYTEEWIFKIDDITNSVKKIKQLIDSKKIAEAKQFLPNEQIYFH